MTVKDSALGKLRSILKGDLLSPRDDEYDAARRIFNAMIDRRPAVIARCTNTADVVACVRFAREHSLMVAVRGGGHSIGGLSLCEDGLVIDLSPMKDIRVDAGARRVRAQPGLTLAEFDRATHAAGLATTMGVASTTGIAGLTLGGGLGWLMGKHGLACDNLLSATVVTADGAIVTASATEHPDLFWGLRGGGGNFGIVTEFEYRVHPLTTVLGGAAFYPVEKAREVLQFFRELTANAPDELTCAAGIVPDPQGITRAAIVVCHSGPLSAGEKLARRLDALGPAVINAIGPMPYVQQQALFEPLYPTGWYHFWKSTFLRGLGDDALAVLIEQAIAKPHPMAHAVLEHVHGAARNPREDTAFANREHEYNLLIVGMSPEAKDASSLKPWARRFWNAMRPHSAGRAYVNYLVEDDDERTAEAYGANYQRLAALKSRYDPTNFLRMNQNIRPEVSETAGRPV
ncbi:MAG TPA: FAD-binding oxidoreductase [Methylomirabilota bacterium]|jgi:FAD/FMN-containing dehydrogenase